MARFVDYAVPRRTQAAEPRPGLAEEALSQVFAQLTVVNRGVFLPLPSVVRNETVGRTLLAPPCVGVDVPPCGAHTTRLGCVGRHRALATLTTRHGVIGPVHKTYGARIAHANRGVEPRASGTTLATLVGVVTAENARP